MTVNLPINWIFCSVHLGAKELRFLCGYSMLSTEEVCSWFKELYPPMRIQLVCNLLQLCLPLELRFIGLYLEELARRDYNYLREAENRANDPQELEKLTDIFDTETRAKITTYLALIHSSNTACSSALYNTLTCIILPALERSNRHRVDSNFASEILLSLTMAAYHPSFSFNQRQRLSYELHNIRKLFQDQSSSVSRVSLLKCWLSCVQCCGFLQVGCTDSCIGMPMGGGTHPLTLPFTGFCQSGSCLLLSTVLVSPRLHNIPPPRYGASN